MRATGMAWNQHNAPRLGAALAYYTVLSLAPLLVVVIAIAGFVFGEQAARGEIEYQVESLVGRDMAGVIQSLLQNAARPAKGIFATSMGAITLLAGASAVFAELRDTLNLIWGYTSPARSGLQGFLRYRLVTFGMVLIVGFLLLASLVISAVLAFLTRFVQGRIVVPGFVMSVLEPLVSICVITLLFALIYKYIPDIRVRWEDVWTGAAFTSILFTAGKRALGIYLSHAGVGSAYGAAGSLVVMLVWVFYSSQIFLFGAEFTKVHSDWRKRRLVSTAL